MWKRYAIPSPLGQEVDGSSQRRHALPSDHPGGCGIHSPAGLDALPLVRALSPALKTRLLEALDPVSAPDGTVLAHEGDPADAALVVTEGQVELSQAGQLRPCEPAPQLIDLASVVDGAPREVTIRARGEVHGAWLPRAFVAALLESEPRFATALTAQLVADVRREHRDVLAREAQLERFAALHPGPWSGEALDRYALVLGVDPEWAASRLPDGLRLTQPVVAWTFDPERRDCIDDQALQYAASTAVLPVEHQGQPALLWLESWLDDLPSIAVSRARLRLPRRFAAVRPRPQGVDFDIAGRHVARVAWTRIRRCAPPEAITGPLRPWLGVDNGRVQLLVADAAGLLRTEVQVTREGRLEALQGARLLTAEDWWLRGPVKAATRAHVHLEFEPPVSPSS